MCSEAGEQACAALVAQDQGADKGGWQQRSHVEAGKRVRGLRQPHGGTQHLVAQAAIPRVEQRSDQPEIRPGRPQRLARSVDRADQHRDGPSSSGWARSISG